MATQNDGCPRGFVKPENPLDPRVIWPTKATPGGCAYACQLPGYFTDDESQLLTRFLVVASAAGLPMITSVLFTWLTSKLRMEKQYLIFIFIFFSAFFTMWLIIAGVDEHRFCHDNATEMDQSDGVSVCVVEAAVIVYCLLAISFCWTIQCFELFVRIVWKGTSRAELSHSILRKVGWGGCPLQRAQIFYFPSPPNILPHPSSASS